MRGQEQDGAEGHDRVEYGNSPEGGSHRFRQCPCRYGRRGKCGPHQLLLEMIWLI